METEQPIAEANREIMRDIGKILDQTLAQGHKRMAFALFVFPFGAGDDHRSDYISNANREDMIATLKEFIARAEGTFVERSGGTV